MKRKAHARERDSLLCDIFESFIGALYLDQGVEPVRAFAAQVIFPKLDEVALMNFLTTKRNYREVAQKNGPFQLIMNY